MKRLGVVVPMPHELKPLLKRVPMQAETIDGRTVHSGKVGDVELRATITKIGTDVARATTEFVIDNLDVDHVVLIGIAGGLGPNVQIGDLLVPAVVIDHDTKRETHPTPLGGHVAEGTLYTSGILIVDPAILDGLAAGGAAGIDMETSAVGAVCEDRGMPWSVFRSFSDHVRDSLIDEAMSKLMTPDGSANIGRLVRYLAPNPLRARKLAKLAKDMTKATNCAANALVESLATSSD